MLSTFFLHSTIPSLGLAHAELPHFMDQSQAAIQPINNAAFQCFISLSNLGISLLDVAAQQLIYPSLSFHCTEISAKHILGRIINPKYKEEDILPIP